MEIDQEEFIEELARRLCAAPLSTQLGVSLQTAYKHVQGVKIGPYWLMLAHAVMRDAHSGFDYQRATEMALKASVN